MNPFDEFSGHDIYIYIGNEKRSALFLVCFFFFLSLQIDVVSFGWTKEASASYGLRPDVRQVGVIAQQVKAASSVCAYYYPRCKITKAGQSA